MKGFLSQMVAKLVVGDVLYVTWRYHGCEKQTWRGKLVEKPTPKTCLIDYGACHPSGFLPLPPVDSKVRIVKFTVVKRRLSTVLQNAKLGHFVTYVYKLQGQLVKRVGVCVYVSPNLASCKVKFFEDSSCYWIPAPKSLCLEVLNLRFFPPFTPTRGVMSHAELQRSRRLQQLVVVDRPANGSSAPLASQQSPPTQHTTAMRGERGRLTLSTWNCRTLGDRSKLDCLICVLTSRCIDLTALQETRRTPSSPSVDIGRWMFIESTLSSGHHGVATLISPRLARCFVSSLVLVEGRVLVTRLRHTTIINVYMPTFDNTDERQSTFDILTSFVATLHRRDILILLGDFNSRQITQVRQRTSALPLYLAAHEFHDFLIANDLTTQLVLTKNTTIQATHGTNTLDYCVFPARQRNILLNYNTSYIPISSDHKLLSVRVSSRLFRLPKTVQTKSSTNEPRFDYTALRSDPLIRSQFVSHFYNVSQYSDFAAALLAARDILPHQLPVRMVNSYNSHLVKSLVMMEARLRDHDVMLTAADAHRASEVERLVGMYTRLLRSNPRLAWTHISALRRKAERSLPAPSTATRLERFTTHFTSLFGREPVVDEPLRTRIFAPVDPQLPFDTGPISLAELHTALRSIAPNKATGADSIPNEVLLLTDIHPCIVNMLNYMLRDSLPQALRSSILVPIFKKGDVNTLNNWRGISLMPTITKLFNRVLLNRIRKIDSLLHWGQNGFRPERNTAGHIISLTTLCDIAKTRPSFELHGLYVDFSKAFDSITWISIELALKRFHVPDFLIKCIMKVMHGHELHVRADGTVSDTPIPVTLGVLQGDTLAPFLFVLVLDAVLGSLPEIGLHIGPTAIGRSGEDFILTVLGFADDLLLLGHTADTVQALLRSLEAAAKCVGLSINYGAGKTERFCMNSDPGTVSDSAGNVVPVVHHYKYLGVFATDPWVDLEKRKSKCWSALTSISHIWKSNLRMTFKRDLAYALVEPIFAYGIGAWPLTRPYEDAIDNAFGRMLRYACGLAPALASRHIVPSESLYGDHPFMSTHIRTRRINFLAHALRATVSGRVNHPFIHLFFWEVPPELHRRRRGGQRLSLQQSILRDCGYEYVEELLPILLNNRRTTALLATVTTSFQDAKLSRINSRRDTAADNRTIQTIARSILRRQPDVPPTAPAPAG